jgi:hypothetical protein
LESGWGGAEKRFESRIRLGVGFCLRGRIKAGDVFPKEKALEFLQRFF